VSEQLKHLAFIDAAHRHRSRFVQAERPDRQMIKVEQRRAPRIGK
jgi:hypothetical protein